MRPDSTERLKELLTRRILVLDGSWGVMIQRRGLSEVDFRADRFVAANGYDEKHQMKGNNDLLSITRPDVIAIESLFHARNVRSALTLGHARGVAVLAAVQSDVPMAEYAPTEIKAAVVGHGAAEKAQASYADPSANQPGAKGS
mgnify:CR=1 FL=1